MIPLGFLMENSVCLRLRRAIILMHRKGCPAWYIEQALRKPPTEQTPLLRRVHMKPDRYLMESWRSSPSELCENFWSENILEESSRRSPLFLFS